MGVETKFLLNGRFLTRPLTGVDRVATELAMALVARLGRDNIQVARPAHFIVDKDARPKDLLALDTISTFKLKGYIWEQFSLPSVASKSWLLNLCNLGPVLRSRQVVMIHDAQVFSQPETYSRIFKLVYHLLLPLVARRAQVVLTVSNYSRLELEKYGVVPRGKAIVVHNGVDHMGRISCDSDTLSRFGLEQGEYFLAIGSLAAHKNLPMLIEAAKSRQDTSCPLVIAGGGNSKVFKDAGMFEGDGVKFLGRVSDEDLKALYCGAKCLVFPSKTEGFGLPPLEAMYCGCPVIATTGGAVPEVCGDAALFADPNIPQEWTDAMDRIKADRALREELIQRGQQQVAEFTWTNAAEKLLSAVQDAEART